LLWWTQTHSAKVTPGGQGSPSDGVRGPQRKSKEVRLHSSKCPSPKRRPQQCRCKQRDKKLYMCAALTKYIESTDMQQQQQQPKPAWLIRRRCPSLRTAGHYTGRAEPTTTRQATGHSSVPIHGSQCCHKPIQVQAPWSSSTPDLFTTLGRAPTWCSQHTASRQGSRWGHCPH